MKLSVVILNYNVHYFLELCIKSVQAALHNIDAEIIVVDNNSEDGSCTMVKQLFPEVILIENKENLGFSKGNNIGVAQAKGEYLCILNPDTVVAEDTFTKLIAFSQSKTNLGIVGCKLINGRGQFLPESKRNVPTVRVSLKKFLGNDSYYYANQIDQEEIGEAPVLVGAFMFLKQSLYNEIGGFDEDYFMYGEDIDLSYRVLKSGRSNYYYGGTTVIHYKGESTLRDSNYAQRFFGAMQLFYQKHFKKNILFDFFVWFGIKLVYALRKPLKKDAKQVNDYIYVSDERNEKLEANLSKNTLLSEGSLNPKDYSEVIFNANNRTYKSIIEMMLKSSANKTITYKIQPSNSKFILGSDDAISRGEVIHF